MALAARHVVRDDDAVADHAPGHARAERDDLADDLVAQDGRHPGPGVDDLRDVGAAEPAALEAQEGLAVADRRPREVLRPDAAGSAEDGRFHRLASAGGAPTPRRPAARTATFIGSPRRRGGARRPSSARRSRASGGSVR